MFDSAKNNLTLDTIFVERVRTLLFLSMGLKIPISVLFPKSGEYIDNATVKIGIVTIVSGGGSNPVWKKSTSGSFKLDTDNDVWEKINDVYALSFSRESNPISLLESEGCINRTQHLRKTIGEFGRKRLDLEIDDSSEAKYYRIVTTQRNLP